ncbi:MAG: substrate-binding domain-containing protein [Planctomycetota bacterium]
MEYRGTRGHLRLTLLALAAFSLAGCEASKSATGPVIGVSLLTLQHDFYKDLEQGLRAAAADKGLEVRITSAEFDPARQASQLDTFAVQRVDAVIVSPCDSAGIEQVIRKLNAAKIPVFTADIAAQGGDVVCHVASDNYQGGQLAGRTLAELLGGVGEVMVIDHPEVTSVQDRVRGFLDEVAKSTGMTVIDRPSAGGKRDRAFAVTETKLQAHPNLRGIFAINDDSALGALQAVGARDVVIIGYDGTPEARAAIARGTALKADVVQYPDRIGRRVIEEVANYLAQKSVPGRVPMEVGVIDRDSAAPR